MADIRVVVAEGRDPTARGRQLGRGLGDLIEGSIAFYTGYLERRGVGTDDLREFLAPHLAAAQANLPSEVALLRGMAEGAMVPFGLLFAVNAFEELEPLVRRPVVRDRCSSFAVRAPDHTLLGHNEQWLAGDLGNVAVVIERPGAGEPAVASPTVVCCLPSVGMNEHGGSQAIQSLVANDDGVGVPRVLVSRHAWPRPTGSMPSAGPARPGAPAATPTCSRSRAATPSSSRPPPSAPRCSRDRGPTRITTSTPNSRRSPLNRRSEARRATTG